MRKLFIFVFALIILLGVSFVIAASAPAITNVQIKPSPAYSTDVLNCSANYNDADGDKGNVSISWYNGSTLYSNVTIKDVANGAVVENLLGYVPHRYWRFKQISVLVSHSPRTAELQWGDYNNVTRTPNSFWHGGTFMDENGWANSFDGTTNIVDSGWIASNTGFIAADFGVNGYAMRNFRAWSCYAGGMRGGNYSIDYSDDNSTWVTVAYFNYTTINRGVDYSGWYDVNWTIPIISPQAKGETWNCTINATDSQGSAGVPNSKTMTISSLGTAPAITDVQIKPSPAYSTDVINCSANYNDADGDKGNVSISWYNGSTLYWQATQFNKINGEQVNEPLTWFSTNGLVGYWKFSEGNGANTNDISTNKFGGSITNAQWTVGKYGSGIYFDGSGDEVKIQSSTFWNFTSDFSVAFWVYPQTTASGNIIGDYYIGGTTTPPDWQLIFTDASQSVSFWRGATIMSASSNSVLKNAWSHVVLTRNGTGTALNGSMAIYINGSRNAIGNFTTGIGRGLNLYVGIDGNDAAEPFKGIIDEVMIYNRSLSPVEVQEIYANSPHASGETWNCTINATDSAGTVGVPNSKTITISSSSTAAPTITNVQIKPSPAYDNSTLNCSANYNDADGDKGNVSISWYNGSTLYWQATQFNKANGEIVNEPLSWVDKNSLVGYWKFSEGNGTQVNDLSGWANTGTLTSFNFSSLNGWREGKFGSALFFDGYDTCLKVSSGASDELNPMATLTVSAWVNVNTAKSSAYIITKGWGDSYELKLDSNNKLTLTIVNKTAGGTDSQTVTSVNALTNGIWYHVAGTYDGTNLKVYINGNFENLASYSKTMLQTSQGVGIGCIPHMGNYQYFGNGFNGAIDEVMIFNRSLTSGEISEIYSASPHARGETWNCTINATDSQGSAGLPNSATKTISSISMYAPTIDNVQIKPSPAYSTDVINCSANYNDGDGDKGNVSISWYNGSTLYWQITQFNKLSGEQVNEPLTWIDKNGLVGYWKFSEGNGTQVTDISRNGVNPNNGNLMNFNFNANSGWVDGKYGKALSFDGSNDYVDAGTSIGTSLNGGSELTIAGWFNLDSVTADDGLYAFRVSGDGNWYWNIRPGGSKFWVASTTSGGGYLTNEINNPFSAGNWVHLATTYTSGHLRTYKNGVLIDDYTTPTGTVIISSGAGTYIGAYATPGGYTPDGTIDEFMIYNRSLDADEISALYSNSPQARGETWNCTINATDSQGQTGGLNSTTIRIEEEYEPKWKHVTVTYSASKKEKKIYVDNVLIRTEKLSGLGSYKINNQTGNLYVSKLYGVPSGNMFNGSIDEMRIYPYALSSSEVGSAYLGSVSYDKLPNQNEAATLMLNGEDVTEMTLAPIVRVSNKERTCEVTSKVKIPKCA